MKIMIPRKWRRLFAGLSANGKRKSLHPGWARGLAASLAILLCVAAAWAQNTLMVYEDFQTTPVGTVPSNFAITGTAAPTLIEVTDAFGTYLNGRKAFRFEDRNLTSIPYATITNTTAPTNNLAKGWMRLRFIPVDNGSTYVTPRHFFKLRGALNQTAVWLQIHGTNLYYYDQGVTPVRMAQAINVNQENDLLLWFDMNSKTARGELNSVPLTKATNPGEELTIDPFLPAQVVDMQLRAGDGAADKEAVLIKLVELGEGDGPENSHSGTNGVIRVKVTARPLAAGQTYDDAPTAIDLHFPQLLSMAGFKGRVRLSSLKVVPAGSTSPEFPSRWYDRDAPMDFPVCVQALNASPTGQLVKESGQNFGVVYPVFGDSGIGRLAWLHRQNGTADSEYDILFETQSATSDALEPGPLKWVGDGSARFEYQSNTTCGTSHVRVAVTDWDGDGRKDIIFGEQYGLIFFLKNVGTATVPSFVRQEYVRGDDGNPISVGFAAAPVMVDWDGDNREDLLVGTHYNRIAWFRNVGSNTARKFSYQGILKIGSAPLELPASPNGGGVGSPYTKDYYPVLEAVDWDNDGDRDLLAGGYVTGKIFLYRNTGTSPGGAPILQDGGAITLHDASGNPLNDVGDWCAAPTVADVNNDGKKDLITGLWDRVAPTGFFLRLFLNNGTDANPNLVEAPLPRTGSFPGGGLSSPRLADMNGDGKLDLVVSTGKNAYIFRNVGTISSPNWEGSITPIKTPWANSPLGVTQFLPINGDAKPDIYSAFNTFLNTNAANPYGFAGGVSIFSGTAITHPSQPVAFGGGINHPGGSTANIQHKLFDLDRDGKLDFLYADWHGQVWYHRNTGSSGPPYTFEPTGVKLTRESGGPVISVDLTNAADYVKVEGGARPVFTIADFNNDGRNDLVLGDTFGNVRYFRGAGTVGAPGTPVQNPHLFKAEVFLKPEVVPGQDNIQENMRGIDATDWDSDGHLDVITGSNKSESVTVYRNKGTASPTGADFEEGEKPELPGVTQPVPIATDLNGDGGAEDLFLPGTQGSFWVERSFIDDGYAPASMQGLTH